jgi:alanyl-tRNA synthetase
VKQGIRVEFVCGGRAVTSARRDYQALVAAANVFTAHPHELPQLVAKKIEEAKAADKERRKLLDMLAGYEAQELHRHSTPDTRGLRSVEKIFDSADLGFLRFLSAQVTQYPGVRAVLVLRKPPTLIAAQTRGLTDQQGGVDLGAIFKKLTDLGLKGGGSRDAAQAGAPDDISLDRALERLREELV